MLLLSVSVSALAVAITPFWANTSQIIVAMTFDNGKGSLGAKVTGNPGTCPISGYATLERKNSNNTYTLVETWDGLSSSTNILTFDKTYYVSRSYTYRLTIYATVYSNGKGEDVSGSFETYAS